MSIAAFAASCGGSKSNSPPPTQNVTVSVSPVSATVAPNGSVLFTATVSGTTNTAVTWSAGTVQGGNATFGTISASGIYTAPASTPNPSRVTITAVSVADTTKSGTAVVDVLVHHINQDFQNPPIKLGTSGGNATDKTTTTNPSTGQQEILCCSGTLGSLVSRGNNLYILSNNHVLDKSDQGTPGDPISQPGLADTMCGRNPSTIVANLTQAAPLNSNSNVDAALAQVVPNEIDQTGAILDLAGPGQPAPPSSTVATPAIGQSVAKSGDATGVTCSTIQSISLDVSVKYQTQCQGGTPFSVLFKNQVGIGGGAFSSNGDSGSLIITADNSRPVALLYAASPNEVVGNPIQDVLSALKDPQSNEVPKVVGGADRAVSCPATPQSQVSVETGAPMMSSLQDSEVARATAVKNLRSAELMQDSAVIDVGVGRSGDNPNESAILVFLKDEPPQTRIPAQIDGVRTKVIRGSEFRPLQNSAQRVPVLPGISGAEVTRVRGVKERHAENLMSNPAIFGVGVGASNDSAGEGALVIFVERGKQVAVPPEIDGVRTRVIESDPFRAFNWGKRTVKACSRR